MCVCVFEFSSVTQLGTQQRPWFSLFLLPLSYLWHYIHELKYIPPSSSSQQSTLQNIDTGQWRATSADHCCSQGHKPEWRYIYFPKSSESNFWAPCSSVNSAGSEQNLTWVWVFMTPEGLDLHLTLLSRTGGSEQLSSSYPDKSIFCFDRDPPLAALITYCAFYTIAHHFLEHALVFMWMCFSDLDSSHHTFLSYSARV